MTSDVADQPLPSSFRDPSGFVFKRSGVIYRKVQSGYEDTYRQFMQSGLYAELTEKKLLIPHEEVPSENISDGNGLLIRPQQIPFISYPYEWCFEQLKDAALLTLTIAETAFQYGMVLKDASAYNVQFLNGKPIFIDTLSFEPYQTGSPWVAYGQFCRHFLAPLWLIAKKDYRCTLILRNFIDGIPLDYACELLGPTFRFSLTEFIHLRLHARLQKKKSSDKGSSVQGKSLAGTALEGLIDSLKSGIRKLEWIPGKTEWADYYQHTNYSDQARCNKEEVVRKITAELRPEAVWDIGANDGTFSRIAAEYARQVVALDIDPVAVNSNYKKNKQASDVNVLPLLADFTNPSPGIGWLCEERDALFQRGPADLVMALAVMHHFCISNNVSFERLVSFFASITGNVLLVEFVPKMDSQVEILLATRADVFSEYTLDAFKKALSVSFKIEKEFQIEGSKRTLLLAVRKD